MPKSKRKGKGHKGKPKKARSLTKQEVSTIIETTLLIVGRTLQAHHHWSEDQVLGLIGEVGAQLGNMLQPEEAILKAVGEDITGSDGQAL